ncbi:unnamed protein product [Sphagnum jensenii]|uniref:Uncharacterized protein n=1 Tax=Sphagnum jensenii TaxID=128206 RepID=A0ABP1BSI9_9BRYO
MMPTMRSMIAADAQPPSVQRRRPQAVQPQAPNYSRPPTEAMGLPGAMEILNSIEGSLENVPTSVVSSDNDPVVPDSVVEIEMASLALPA